MPETAAPDLSALARPGGPPELRVSAMARGLVGSDILRIAAEVRAHFGDAVLRSVIPRSVKVSEAPGYGMTVLDYDPGSRGAMSYLDAGRELAARGHDKNQGNE